MNEEVTILNERILSRIPENGNIENMSIDDHIENMMDMRLSCALPVENWDRVEISTEILDLSIRFRDNYGVKTLKDLSELVGMTGMYPASMICGIYNYAK